MSSLPYSKAIWLKGCSIELKEGDKRDGLINYLLVSYFLKVSSQATDFTSRSRRYLR